MNEESVKVPFPTAIEMSIEELENINIKVSMIEQVGLPILHVISNLEHCLDTLDEIAKAKAQPKEDAGNEEVKPDV